jgi:DNA-binding NarL/FixJ family response regulator
VRWVHVAQVEGDGPFTQSIRGDWMAAASYWDEIGCPYERAQALIEGDQPAVQQALQVLLTLRAAPAIDCARQRLRQMGVTRVPRGQRASTLAHPASLTLRESEILVMLALGLRNAQIAKRLFVSPKTVERHVSSILAKLNAPTREAAVTDARQEGWLAEHE